MSMTKTHNQVKTIGKIQACSDLDTSSDTRSERRGNRSNTHNLCKVSVVHETANPATGLTGNPFSSTVVSGTSIIWVPTTVRLVLRSTCALNPLMKSTPKAPSSIMCLTLVNMVLGDLVVKYPADAWSVPEVEQFWQTIVNSLGIDSPTPPVLMCFSENSAGVRGGLLRFDSNKLFVCDLVADILCNVEACRYACRCRWI